MDWFFKHSNWKDLKYRGHAHPIVVASLTVAFYIMVATQLDKHLSDHLPFALTDKQRLGFAGGVLLYVFAMFATRYA